VRTVAIIAASLIGLTGVGAFASNAYHHRSAVGAGSGSHTPGASATGLLDNTATGDSTVAGKYCPIPPRGRPEKGLTAATAVGSTGDSLILGGQSVAPAADTASALCIGTAAPAKRP